MRRRDAIGLLLLVPGIVPVYAAFVTLGNRVFPAADVARSNRIDHAVAYFLGPEGDSLAELARVLGWMAIGVIGIALIAVGYRLITATRADDEPPLRPVDAPGVWHRFDM